MKIKLKNIISLLLTVVILLSAFSSCNEIYEDSDNEDTDAVTGGSETGESDSPGEAAQSTLPGESSSSESIGADPETEESVAQDEPSSDTSPGESGSLGDPDVAPETEDNGSLSDPIKPTEPSKEKPENPKTTLYKKSKEQYSSGNIGSKEV